MIKGKRIMVTGGGGFIGSYLVKKLAQDNNVVVLDNHSDGVIENWVGLNVQFVKGDICEPVDMEGIDIVFHLAAITDIEESMRFPQLTDKVNYEGTTNILNRAIKAGVGKFVYASSAAVYGNGVSIEASPQKPLSPYGISKMMAEAHCLEHSNFIDVVCLRYFNVYGIGNGKGVILKFMDNIKQKRPITIYGDGNQLRDFVYVDDVVDATLLSIEAKGIFNIGSGHQYTINELYETLCEITGQKVEVVNEPMRKGELQKSVADITKAKKILGYCPQWTLAEGLKTMWREESKDNMRRLEKK